jgi:hypothetical protein
VQVLASAAFTDISNAYEVQTRVDSKADFWFLWKQDSRKNSNHGVSVCVHISMKAACFGDEKLSFIRSFHSSTLFFRRALPKAEHFLYSPLWYDVWTQLDIHRLWATIHVVRWVESWGWYNARWKWPSFGCLNFFFFLMLANLRFLLTQFYRTREYFYFTLHLLSMNEYIYLQDHICMGI